MIQTAKQHVSEAFNLVSAISVHGDTVDVMAHVRHELRMAYAELKKMEVTETDEADEVSADG